MTLPANNVVGADPGIYPAVSDGYWVALSSLALGTYDLHFTATESGTGAYEGVVFTNGVTYHINLVPEPASWLLLGVGLTGWAGARWRRGRSGCPASRNIVAALMPWDGSHEMW